MNLKETIFLVPKGQDWIDLMQWIDDNTCYQWGDGEKPTKFNNWREGSFIMIDEYGDIGWSDIGYHKKYHTNYAILNARDFLNDGEEVPTIIRIKDNRKSISITFNEKLDKYSINSEHQKT